jgi:hypothetical protein
MQGGLALNGRERTVLCSVGGEQAEAQDPGDLGWQRHERPASVKSTVSTRPRYSSNTMPEYSNEPRACTPSYAVEIGQASTLPVLELM